MFGQTFEIFDLFRIVVLGFLEILLSADNAIVLALIARALPLEQRRKALFIGLISSFIFRAIGLLTVSLLLEYAWIQGIGALYLIYLSARHFIGGQKNSSLSPEAVRGFWKTVLLIELFDLAFAVDSIVAGVAFISSIPSTGLIHQKIWIVYAGAILGLIAIRFAAKLFINLIDRFPRLEMAAYLMIGWIGLKLGISAAAHTWTLNGLMSTFEPIFWTVLALLFIYGLVKKNVRPRL